MNTIGTVQMIGPPNGYSRKPVKYQPKDFASNGDPYIYNKSPITRITHSLFYSRQSTTLKNSLLAQFEAVDGTKTKFTWNDHAGVDHSVRYAAGSFDFRKAEGDTWNLSFTLEEDI